MAHFSYAVVVERQTRYLEGVVSIGRVGSNPTDRISHDRQEVFTVSVEASFFVNVLLEHRGRSV